MTFIPRGCHLIAGEWVKSGTMFESTPVTGEAHSFSEADTSLVDRAAEAAEATFPTYGNLPSEARAGFLNAIADEIEARGAAITEIGRSETGLPAARLEGERGRTTGQLRLFANHILDGRYQERRHDPALPERSPLPRPDLRLVHRPIGPVAVFGASNFPLAFSTAGGDTAAALAAGCPVVVKGHPAHPGTCEIVAEAIHAAIGTCDVPPGTFSLLQSAGIEAGGALVTHPLIQAVGFTGSLKAGRALFDLCAARDVPIPFFGELGSVNPVFLLPGALGTRAKELGTGWAGSLTLGVGQFCTNPGVVVALEGPETDRFVDAAAGALQAVDALDMLTAGIAAGYRGGREALAAIDGVETRLETPCRLRQGAPGLMVTTGARWLQDDRLGEEIFGPSGLVVKVRDTGEMLDVARSLEGQLTATLQMDPGDAGLARRLMPVLERKAGRILVNGFPTGVEVADAMVHGGPYPATTNFGATSVGTLAIRRFLRPVCYQDVPEDLLPRG